MFSSKIRFFLLMLLCLSLVPMALGESMHPYGGTGLSIEPPLQRPSLTLKFPKKLQFPITGFSEETQKFFNQGIWALHGFWNYEAERNFREVIRRQPEHPIGYAFVAFAQTVFGAGDLERGARFDKLAREKLLEGKQKLTETEMLWIEAIHSHYDESVSKIEDRRKNYIDRLKRILGVCKDKDVLRETTAFLAIALWNYQIGSLTKPEEKIDLQQEADRYIEDVLGEIPGHPAHHYKIHLRNTGAEDVLAWGSLLQCGPNNPSCAHLWHMTSHIKDLMGLLRNAAYYFEAALRVDNLYLTQLKLAPAAIHNYAHNLQYFLRTLNQNGGIDRALRVAKNQIAGGRAFYTPIPYFDPVDWTAQELILLLEDHLMWKEGETFEKEGFFQGLFNRPDPTFLARAIRFSGICSLENGDKKRAEESITSLKRLRLSLKNPALHRSLWDEIEKMEKDLQFWKVIRDSKEPHSIPQNAIDSLLALKITPVHRMALLLQEEERFEDALKLAKKAVEDSPQRVMPRAVLTYLLLKNRKQEEAMRAWNATKPLIHLPISQEHVEKPSILGAFPFLKTVRDAFVSSKYKGSATLVQLFETTLYGRQYSKRSWEKANGVSSLADLGNIYLTMPVAPLGEGHKALWAKTKLSVTEPVKKALKEGTTDANWILFVFRQEEACKKCSEQEKILQGLKENFARQRVELVIIYPEAFPTEKRSPGSHVYDEELHVFRAFGAVDTFENKPAHGVFLVGKNSRIRWHWRGDHAFQSWSGLEKEIQRLRHLRLDEDFSE